MSNNSAIDIYLRVRPTDKPSEMLSNNLFIKTSSKKRTNYNSMSKRTQRVDTSIIHKKRESMSSTSCSICPPSRIESSTE